MMTTNPPSQARLELELERLRAQVIVLEQENADLKMLLENVTSHADFIEAELHATNERLQEEVGQRMKTMRALQFLIGMVARDISDLQILLETTTEHGDLVEQLLHNESIRDPLTGLFNRRYLDQNFENILQGARHWKQSVGVVLGDIDFFRTFNTEFGHKAGDVVLKEVCEFLQKNVRDVDSVYRYGGEEILLLLPGASLTDTVRIAESLREGIYKLSLSYGEQNLSQISISFGVACFPKHGTTVDELVIAADTALYQAKAAGRNCTIVATLDSESSS
ncbi:diguanylate cyclase [Spirulina subsalsa FACHB-351]|uniref:Diguanylate cyclase n=1 Tax=Spirulina subsalsa FACHB-351 TaxID=234711 RepID=A0ABT3L2A9_9CYAN|nr:diguanylate cyclase [Spirulina subsalsa]MCW6035155.1 diguanylate cyclase [Spirulina subsalsa FACHB-351]